MTYRETLDWMFVQLPMYQQQGASAYRKDLTNTLLLCDHLGHPERNLQCIHVAGTNGKGSTSHMLASVLQEAGYKVGLYTSPHLKDFRERIKINGTEIGEDSVVRFIDQHKSFFEAHALSFFEMTVGLAFDYFVQQKVDIAIVEVGMGGRLDSTNVITPLVSVITNIGLDHMAFLGNTLESIAVEKAGIIKPGVPVVVGEYLPQTKPVFAQKAAECHSSLFFASDLVTEDHPSDLLGNYQFHNKKTVAQTVRVLRELGWTISEEQFKDGLLNVVKNTGLLGRWQQLQNKPTVIADTAHNKDGLALTIAQIASVDYDRLHVVLGVVNDKDLAEILPLFPKNAHYYFCKPNLPRGLDAQVLAEHGATFGLRGSVFDSVRVAYENALQQAAPNDFVYVGGSTFVVAEIL
ncbi:bifunctional folylpolyglutamate synthase/dihydrofolate synthase [Flavobacterium caeni]|uniref:Dihydrofolate synthase/folylpolyglutamate synthase n=1 Tax=Flavobacterium caeni TaxID=490189 RepID=A0A1G5F3V9_9FLAO|nr:folylpolyglutamate synthase/dihydrofolate synthase family protein [Flavobacterium caeni]SCY33791.1 dihydrofolate synthase / folylpolyglutamate synthase [Flavobacterium caeni]